MGHRFWAINPKARPVNVLHEGAELGRPDTEMAAINIKQAEFHGEWNYTISPNTYPPNCAFIS